MAIAFTRWRSGQAMTRLPVPTRTYAHVYARTRGTVSSMNMIMSMNKKERGGPCDPPLPCL